MSTKHSPGPWEVDERFTKESGRHAQYRIFAANLVCTLEVPIGFYRSPAESEANARLIAAAPELLAALQALYTAEEEYGDPTNAAINEAWLKARAAIARATGE